MQQHDQVQPWPDLIAVLYILELEVDAEHKGGALQAGWGVPESLNRCAAGAAAEVAADNWQTEAQRAKAGSVVITHRCMHNQEHHKVSKTDRRPSARLFRRASFAGLPCTLTTESMMPD